jgi:DNA modification methylase
MKLFPDNSIDLIITDPPYGVNFEDEYYDDSAATVFDNYKDWLAEMSRILVEHSHIYIFVPTLQIDKWIYEVRNFFNFNNIISLQVYQTNRASSIKNNFTFDLQLVIFASKGKARQFNKVNWIPTSSSWLRDKRNPDPQPYTHLYPSFINSKIIRANTKPNEKIKRLHQNEKNPNLIKYWIEMSSETNDIVLDPFCGSGSIGEAAWMSNRRFILIEKNEEYFKRAEERMKKLMKQKKITQF